MATLLQTRDAANKAAKARLLSLPGEPLFVADWERVLMIHYEVEPASLQAVVPFELDLREGKAYVSLVAFTMTGMRPRIGGKLAAWALKPIATHDFLNVRTYVRHGDEAGIFFMTEWLSSRLSVLLGPHAFGLPYRHARIGYRHESRDMQGRVEGKRGTLAYTAELETGASFEQCEDGSLDEWLMERYTAFTFMKNRARFFRVWHEPWKQRPARVSIKENSLLTRRWPFLERARIAGANFSPGAFDVWMGWPHRVAAGRREPTLLPAFSNAEKAF